MTIEVIGPDQSKFQFPDGTPEPTISAAMAQHYGAPPQGPAPEAPAPAKYDPADPRFADQSVKAALRGVPVLGAGLEKASAGISAAAQPLTGVGSDKSTIADRYVANLEQEEAAKADYEKAHPIKSAVEGMVGGGLALGGAAGAVPAVAKGLGMVGPLRTAVPAAVASGAALGGADAAVRGQDPVTGAEVGAITGGLGVIGGKAVGKIWDKARGMFVDAPAPVPTRTMRVNETDVPVRESVITRDPSTSAREQGILHETEGAPAQTVARQAQEATEAAMEAEHARLAASLDPTGQRPATSPMAAGEAISSEVSTQEAARAAAEAARLQAVGAEGGAIRESLNTSATPGVLADTPITAAQQIQTSLVGARNALARRRDQAYDLLRGTEGEYNPAVFQRTGAAIRRDLNRGNDPVRIDARTPGAAQALEDIELNVGQRRFENQAQTELQRGPDGRPVEPPITAETIDSARKRLISIQRQTNQAARSTGDYTDARAVRRIINAFDDHVATATRTPGGFSGDPEELLSRLSNARRLHTTLKQGFGPRNAQDDVGKAIEAIVGKRDVAPAEMEKVAGLLFGSNEGAGQVPARMAQRLVDMFGENSPQVAQLKQGLISHLLDTPAGVEPLSHTKAADKIHKFFSGGKTVTVAQTLFSPSERARFLAHANRMRGAADPAPENHVEKVIAKWAGRDGGLKASPKTIIDDLMGSTGTKGTAPAVIDYLKRHTSPDTVGQLKQAMWHRITESDGAIPWKDQKVGERIIKFLDGDGAGMAKALYTPAEIKAMRELGNAHIKLLPIEGTTNPSKSGYVIARTMKSMAHSLLPFLGFHAGGLPGAAAALGAKSIAGKITDRRGAQAARELFYGPQPRRASSRMPQSFGALSAPIAIGQSNQRER
jgi:hypothetical protein